MERLLIDRGYDGYNRWSYVLALLLMRRFKYILKGGWGFKSVRFECVGRTEREAKEKMLSALENGIYCLQEEQKRTKGWLDDKQNL